MSVAVYISSTSGDRRATKHSRWAVDFLTGKKVPHAVIDLSIHPHLRGRLVNQLALASPGRGSPAATKLAEEALQHLPVIDLCGCGQTLSSSEMQDLEDHGELDPLLTTAVAKFAERIAKEAEAETPLRV